MPRSRIQARSGPKAACWRRSLMANPSPATCPGARPKNASRRRCGTSSTAAAARPASAPSRSPPTFATTATGAPRLAQARRRDARRRPRRAGPARNDAAAPPPGHPGRGVARRDGRHQHAGGHRLPGARRSARPAARGRRAGRLHARRSEGQAGADRSPRRARRGRQPGARLLPGAGQKRSSATRRSPSGREH